jgi:hypothetical protein
MSGPPGGGTHVTKLPDPIWCQRAVWGTLSSWRSENSALIKLDTGDTVLYRCASTTPDLRRFLFVDTWFSDNFIGGQDMVKIEFSQKGLKANCYVAPAEDWLTDNFPQEPVRLDGRAWIILTEDDMPLATLANPRLNIPVATSEDAAGFYCPYIPLQHTSVAKGSHAPVVFETRYNLKV